MILRGAQIHRDGHGKCGLLPNPTLSRNNAPLPSASVFSNTRTKSLRPHQSLPYNYKGEVQPTLRLL